MSIYAKAMSLIERGRTTHILKKTERYDVNDIDYDVHTRHCCKLHGCKYGEDEYCTVLITSRKGLTGSCQTCFDDQRPLFDEYDDKYDSYDEDGGRWF